MVSLKLLAVLVQLSALVFARPAAEAWVNANANATANTTAGGSPQPFFFKGYDLSSLRMLEEGGAVYHDSARYNVTRPAEDILGDGGMNTVRLRLWVNSIPGQYDLPYVLALATRFSRKGYRIFLDFHFSDTWADPQHNLAPAAWPTELAPLTSTLRAYVNQTLLAFSRAGVDLSLVSLGNEIRSGMLQPLGNANADLFPVSARVASFTNLATLFAAARRGVDDAVQAGAARPQVMIHIDNGWNLTLQQAWFGALTATGQVREADWDVIGLSFYPFYGTAATLANLRQSLNALAAQYRKPLHVVETDWPAICDSAQQLSELGIPVSVQGQTEWVHDIIEVVKAVPGGLGQGFSYWEPAWLNLTSLGSVCQDTILFDTDWSYSPRMEAYSRPSVNMLLGV